MQLVPLSEEDKSWTRLKSQWQAECTALGEDFSTFAVGTFGALEKLAADTARASGLHGLQNQGEFLAFCQVNRLLTKAYDGPVVRARFLTVGPKFDLGVAGLGEYAQTVAQIFYGVLSLSRKELPGRHVRLHLRSPADAQYFAGLQSYSEADNPFETFRIRGAWVECSARE